MFELQLANEAQPIAEAVVEQQHEPMEIEPRIFVLGLVEMEIHVARDWARLRNGRLLCVGGGRCGSGGGSGLCRGGWLARYRRRPTGAYALQFKESRFELSDATLELFDPRLGRRFTRRSGRWFRGLGGCRAASDQHHRRTEQSGQGPSRHFHSSTLQNDNFD